MTAQEAQRLRDKWKAKDDREDCEHCILSKEVKLVPPDGTEPYFCIVCGTPLSLHL